MKLKDQVCSLELAKKLKELGVKQESLWYWYPGIKGKEEVAEYWNLHCIEEEMYAQIENQVSAFTVAELGEMLKDADWKFPQWDGEYWRCYYPEDIYATEANARTMMLIWLIETGGVKL